MRPPLVSVVIPCFRQGHFLREAVDSALAQTYPAIQVVVVNDGSDDDTDAVVRSYGDQVVYISQNNSGLSAARNIGIRASEGSYLLFLDSDDRLHPHGVENLMASAGEDRLVIGWFEPFTSDPHTDIKPPSGLSVSPYMAGLPLKSALLVGNLAAPCSHLCPRKAATEIGLFDANYFGCEDWDFWVRLVLHGLEVHEVPTVVAYYRRHASSMTARNAIKMGEANVRLQQRNMRELAGRGGAIADRSIGRAELARRVRQTMRKELLDLVYSYRKERAFRAAIQTCLRSIWSCGPGRQELAEVLKTFAVACSPRRSNFKGATP